MIRNPTTLGEQLIGMARDAYESDPAQRAAADNYAKASTAYDQADPAMEDALIPAIQAAADALADTPSSRRMLAGLIAHPRNIPATQHRYLMFSAWRHVLGLPD